MEQRIYLSQPHVTGEEKSYIDKAFQTNNLTLFGDNVSEFENAVAKYLGVKYALAVSSGTAALHLALRYAGVSRGDYVLCPSLTFAASCNPILYQGGIPVLVDSDQDSWNMSPKALQKAIDWGKKHKIRYKAAVVVDLYGQPAKYDELLAIFREENITVVEDAAEAMGAAYQGKKCGTFGDYAAFSFNSNKIITAGGGGMVVSDDKDAIAKMRYWSQQAREPLPYYEHKEYGYQYRMSNILAGIGCAQVKCIDTYVSRRRDIYREYGRAFHGYPVTVMPLLKEAQPNCWLTVVTLDRRYDPLALVGYLERYNIESRMVWKPMHLQPVYKECLYFKDGGDVSKELFETGVCLPSASVMSDEELCSVIGKVKEFLERGLS